MITSTQILEDINYIRGPDKKMIPPDQVAMFQLYTSVSMLKHLELQTALLEKLLETIK